MKQEKKQYINISNALTNRILNTKENAVFSPYSFVCLLGMIYPGLDEQEKKNWTKIFKSKELFDLNMIQFLKDFHSDSVSSANGLFVDYKMKEKVYDTYKHYLEDHFDAEIMNCNDIDLINEWVKEKTKGIIKELNCTPDVLNLLNASTFEGKWVMPFTDMDIDTFKTIDGKQERCWMMHSHEWFYVSNSVYEGFLKYYKDNRYCLMAFLPKKDNQSKLDQIDIQTIDKLYESKEETECKVTIPEFEFNMELGLKAILKNLGIQRIFVPGNSISNMADIDDLFIGEMKQQAYIKVDNNGTKAAALSEMVAFAGCLPINSKILNFNRPFIFSIMDTELELPIFVGRVNRL